MRRVMCLATAASALFLLGSGQAQARAAGSAHLDGSFGRDGRVTLPLPGSRLAAVASDGSIIASNARSLQRLTPNGRLDQSFGEGGTVTPPPAAGGEFAIAGVAVDPQGRLVVAGTSTPPQPPSSAPPESPPPFGFPGEATVTAARILRYLPDGALDPSFGDNGVVETDFELPPPMSEGEQVTPAPLVKVTGVAVDDSGRIVLTGGASAEIRGGCAHDWFWNVLAYAAFVARLTESGAPDTTFGRDGLFGGHEAAENPLRAEFASEPVLSPGGGVTFLRGRGACPRAAGFPGAVQLTATGEPLGIGAPHPNRGSIIAAAAAQDGSIYLLEWPRGDRELVLSLRPDGTVNRSFGRAGRAAVKLTAGEESFVYSIAVDARGRVLLGGIEVAQRPGRRGAARAGDRRSFLLMRLRRRGGPDTGFGTRGAIVTRFPYLSSGADLRLAPDEQGRAVLSGTYRRAKDDRGLAAVRYALGS